jgi:hypothetical protein
MFPRLFGALFGPSGSLRLIVLLVLLALGVAIGGHMYGRRLAASDLAERDTTIQLLRSEGEKLETRYNDQLAQLGRLAWAGERAEGGEPARPGRVRHGRSRSPRPRAG